MPWIVDEVGDRMVFSVLGADPAEPERYTECYIQVAHGGQLIARAATNLNKVTVAPDPVVPPTKDELDREQAERATAAREKERSEAKREREAREGEGR